MPIWFLPASLVIHFFQYDTDLRCSVGADEGTMKGDEQPPQRRKLKARDLLRNPKRIWNDGSVTPFYEPTRDIMKWISQKIGPEKTHYPVATRWTFQGEVLENRHCPAPIPDRSGLVYVTPGGRYWIVLKPDGTLKFRIPVPQVTRRSVPSDGFLGEPKRSLNEDNYIMYCDGSDGDRDDFRFFFNMRNGRLVQVHLNGRTSPYDDY
jgi:hypothetical protein